MSWGHLQDKSIALPVNDALELLDDLGMEFVKFVVRKDLLDELPQNNLLAILKTASLLLFDALNQLLAGGRTLKIVFS